ncbi:MAG: cysteine desulfurase NifS [bacterium]|nr:cysteine desulfurase NifS [bacterium]
MKRVYLDHSATTQVHPEVREAMLPFLGEGFGNPSSLHWFGQEARQVVEDAREKVAGLLGARPEEIVFTSGGTESDNWVLFGSAEAEAQSGPSGGKRNHLITSQIEHHAILHPAEILEKRGYQVTYLGVDRFGMVDPGALEKALTPRTFLVSIMMANNEVGTLQPIAEIAGRLRGKNIVFHTDAVQAVGKIPVDLKKLPVDLLSLSAHKFYGPKGMGVLFIRKGTKVSQFVHGGSQEMNHRAGTENVAGMVGLARALEIATRDLEANSLRLRRLQKRLEEGLKQKIGDITFNVHPEERIPGLVNVSFAYVEGEAILLNLDLQGIAASSGSACTSRSLDPSHVLKAMGVPTELARGSIRFSLGRENTEEEIDLVLEILPGIIQKLRDMSPIYPAKKR